MQDTNTKYRIMIETTNICNAKCLFCSNPQLNRTKKIMDNETFDLIIKRIVEEKINAERFILHLNGEPFTDKDLIERIRILKLRFPKIPINFTTNFSLPDEKKIDELLLSRIDAITISLNSSNPEEYQKIMGLKFEKTINNIEYLLDRNKKLNTNMHIRLSIVDSGDKSRVDEFKRKYSEMAEIRVIKLGRWMGKENRTECTINDKAHYCDDLYHQICILSNGDYALCCFDCEGHVYKNVYDSPILEAFYSEPFEKLRESLRRGVKGTLCEGCSFI